MLKLKSAPTSISVETTRCLSKIPMFPDYLNVGSIILSPPPDVNGAFKLGSGVNVTINFWFDDKTMNMKDIYLKIVVKDDNGFTRASLEPTPLIAPFFNVQKVDEDGNYVAKVSPIIPNMGYIEGKMTIMSKIIQSSKERSCAALPMTFVR